MKKLINTLLLISLFVVFTSSTTSSEAVFTGNQPSLNVESLLIATPSFNEFIGPLEMEVNSESPFCFYYAYQTIYYGTKWVNDGQYYDFMQFTYYSGLYAQNECPGDPFPI
tara:strand:+ start:284 stop:616 length:333 start_codon:yes stop_codon:yes gene_type:complete